ncbi:hypothetical protein M433DRAFT_171828, partial [Acidomyces richmondensis BFW]
MRCGFFLWDDDAGPREKVVLMGNGRTELQGGQHRVAQDEWLVRMKLVRHMGDVAVQEQEDSSTSCSSPNPLSPSISLGSQTHASLKRDASDTLLDEDETGDAAPSWVLTANEELASKIGVYATPTTTTGERKLPWLEQQGKYSDRKTGIPYLGLDSSIEEERLQSVQTITSET